MRTVFILLGCLLAVIGGLTTGLVCALTGLVDRSRRIPLFFNRLFARLFLPVTGIQLKLFGREQVDWEKNYIVCANHQGLFDIFTLMAALPLPLRFVSKPALFRIPFIGWGMWGSGHVKITRRHKAEDSQTLRRIARLASEGASFVMFPEGTRTRDGSLLPFRAGAFKVACESGVAILPATIRGSFERMKKGRLLPIPGTIEITFHLPIDPTGHTVESLRIATRSAILSSFAP